MYYKLYRRRYAIYFLVTIIFVIILLNNKKPNENDIPSDGFDNNDNNNNIYLRRSNNRNGRINVENYVVPEPCHRCPGENGAGVFLNSEESKGIEEVYKKEFLKHSK